MVCSINGEESHSPTSLYQLYLIRDVFGVSAAHSAAKAEKEGYEIINPGS
jgi:hypothetical protein